MIPCVYEFFVFLAETCRIHKCIDHTPFAGRAPLYGTGQSTCGELESLGQKAERLRPLEVGGGCSLGDGGERPPGSSGTGLEPGPSGRQRHGTERALPGRQQEPLATSCRGGTQADPCGGAADEVIE